MEDHHICKQCTSCDVVYFYLEAITLVVAAVDNRLKHSSPHHTPVGEGDEDGTELEKWQLTTIPG